ncbi:MAG: Fic family protein [Actinobacteria bacterium]|nr:Fic family protein [Actinomycetota bacterium]
MAEPSATGLEVSSPYVEALEEQRAALVTALEPVISADDVEAAHRSSARLSVRLDASPLSDATADAVDRGELVVSASEVRGRDGHGWATVLRLDGMPTQDIAAVEYRGVRAAQADEAGLAAQFLAAPVTTLERAHHHIASGLVAAERLGALRRTSRAVHDGAQGRAIFHAPPPAQLPGLLAGLRSWIHAARASVSPLALAGVVHARVLHWRPFEAGNGRVGRIASRIALRATSADPWGLSVPEHTYAADPLRYMAEVAATIRRRVDMRPWNELTGEAIVDSFERVARGKGVTPTDVDARALRAAGTFAPGAAVTVAAFAEVMGSDRITALIQCNRLCWAGVFRRDLGTRGLRYERQQGG